ncbi:Fc.00g008840.m01.CDS01 [Cosmosporella sp. VM-42]
MATNRIRKGDPLTTADTSTLMQPAGPVRQSDYGVHDEPRLDNRLRRRVTVQTVNMESLENQIRCLKAELNGISLERDAAQDGMDKVLSDLVTAESELENERQRTVQKDIQITQLKDELRQLSELANEKDRKLRDFQRQLGAKDDTLRGKIQELAEQTANAQRQETFSGGQLSQHADLDALRRQLAFYKTNGEQVSKRARQIETSYKQLYVSLQDKDRRIQEQDSILAALGNED